MWPFNRDIKLKRTGLLEGFRECHCHLLPGVDDGVKKLEDTLAILAHWESVGVQEVWFTPHVMEDFPNSPEHLQARFQEVQQAYEGPIRLHLAAENMLDNLFPERLEKRELLTLWDNHLLVETSYFNPPLRMEETMEDIKKAGYRPVLAHPERYRYMDMADYRNWKARGVLFQLNFPSLVGAYGPDVQHKAHTLLEKGMYNLTGSDTHSPGFVHYYLDGKLPRKTVDLLRPLFSR